MAKGRKTGGRQKGTPNKVTGDARACIHEAFVELGGAEYLVKVGKKSPAVFCKLFGMTLPKDIKVDVGKTLEQLIRDSYAGTP